MTKADVIAVYIDFTLYDVEFLENSLIPLLKFRLVYLKKLVLYCSRELAGDADLETLLARIEDIVCRNADQIHNCLQLKGDTDHHRLMVYTFHRDIRSLREDFEKWYNIRQSRASCTPDGVLEIISTVAKAVADVRSETGLLFHEFDVEVLEEKLSFLKSLIIIATRLSDEPNYDLLASAESFTIFLAFRLVTLVPGYRTDLGSLISEFSREKLEPVYKTFTQVFGSLKLRPLNPHTWDDDVFVAMEVVVSSLMSDLRDLPNERGTCPIFTQNPSSLQTLNTSLQDLQGLNGGLRSLRATLTNKKVLSSLSVKIKEDLGLAVFDVGIFLYSLHHHALYYHAPSTSPPRTSPPRTTFFTTTHFTTTHQALHHHAPRTSPPRLGLLIKNLFDTINCIRVRVAEYEPSVPMINAFNIYPAGEVEVKRMPSLGASSSTNEVVGFNEAEEVIVNQLTRGSDKLQIVAIVGMPGLGKTTLATKVYNNPSISVHFHVRAWCHASQAVDKKKVLLDLLNQIDPSRCSKSSTEHESEHELSDALRKSLLGRRYLIFLDDMWDIDTWNTLSKSFPENHPGNRGSKVILTSRQHNVAPHNLLVDEKPYFLCQLNEEESLELLQMKCSLGLSVDQGRKVAEKCKGLPLMIVLVAGVLKHAEPEGWDELLDHLSSASIMEQCRNTLELSYMKLPDYLKSCLLYFGTFLDNQEVSVRRLFRLWIAEGFIQRDGIYSSEDCLNDLIGRSLIMVVKQRSLGGVKTCQIHDLIRDFCVQKAKDEGVFHLVRGSDELSAFYESPNLQRLCIHSKAEHFSEFRLFCPFASSLILNSSESVQTELGRTERSGMSRGFHIFKSLKVLNLEHVHFGDEFPSEIAHLVQLTFLAILCEADAIPMWLGNLSSLETFIKLGDKNGWLPSSLWQLKELQYLHLGGGNGYYTLRENLNSPDSLHKLDRISGVVIPYSKVTSLLRKFPNICKLKCRLQYTMRDPHYLVFPNISSRIQSLSLLYVYDDDDVVAVPLSYQAEFNWYKLGIGAQELSLPENLKKLTLGGFSLSSENMSTIGVLPNLEVLKLLRIEFEGKTWVMKEGEFSKLTILKMVDLGLTSWSSDEDADEFPLQCLEKLVLESISKLREMPRCLESIDTLDVIEVSDCHYSVLDLVEHIERRQLTAGSVMKIIRNNIRV